MGSFFFYTCFFGNAVQGLVEQGRGCFCRWKNRTLPVGDSTVFTGVFAMGGYCINVCNIKEGNGYCIFLFQQTLRGYIRCIGFTNG
jgi:hypothetical protein